MTSRIVLFLITNIAVIVTFSVAVFLIERFFGINVSGSMWGGYTGLLIFASLFGFIGAFISLALSKSSAKKAYKITPIQAEQVSSLGTKERLVWDTVESLSQRNNITMPEVGIYQSSDANAFATGASKNNSLVAVSSGLLDSMSPKAIEWVVAHEMAHILNGDMVTMTLLQWIMNTFVIFFARVAAGIIDSYISKWEQRSGTSLSYFAITIVLEIIFGVLASLVTMWFSRHREFKADAGSAQAVWKDKMIAGLQALVDLQNTHQSKNSKFASMQISSQKTSGFKQLFSSHPPLRDRIRALEDLIIR